MRCMGRWVFGVFAVWLILVHEQTLQFIEQRGELFLLLQVKPGEQAVEIIQAFRGGIPQVVPACHSQLNAKSAQVCGIQRALDEPLSLETTQQRADGVFANVLRQADGSGGQTRAVAHIFVDEQAQQQPPARTRNIHVLVELVVEQSDQVRRPLQHDKQLNPARFLDGKELFQVVLDVGSNLAIIWAGKWVHFTSRKIRNISNYSA